MRNGEYAQLDHAAGRFNVDHVAHVRADQRRADGRFTGDEQPRRIGLLHQLLPRIPGIAPHAQTQVTGRLRQRAAGFRLTEGLPAGQGDAVQQRIFPHLPLPR